MDFYWEMVKQMVSRRVKNGEPPQEAVRHVWKQLFGGPMTMEIQEDMYVAIQACKDKFPEFRAEYQRLGKEFQCATMEAANA